MTLKLYHERDNQPANEILCNRIILTCFVNQNIKVNCIETDVVYTFYYRIRNCDQNWLIQKFNSVQCLKQIYDIGLVLSSLQVWMTCVYIQIKLDAICAISTCLISTNSDDIRAYLFSCGSIENWFKLI